MESAIKKAIEGGYKMKGGEVRLVEAILFRRMGKEAARKAFHALLLQDPLFWQCLSKAIGLKEIPTIKGRRINPVSGEMFDSAMHQGHEAIWHRFIDHLIERKSADSFFDNLLK